MTGTRSRVLFLVGMARIPNERVRKALKGERSRKVKLARCRPVFTDGTTTIGVRA